MIFSYFTQSALSLRRLTLWQYEFTLLNTERVSPVAWESALVFHVGPRDFWESDMIHERQREDMAGMGSSGRVVGSRRNELSES